MIKLKFSESLLCPGALPFSTEVNTIMNVVCRDHIHVFTLTACAFVNKNI